MQLKFEVEESFIMSYDNFFCIRSNRRLQKQLKKGTSYAFTEIKMEHHEK